MLGAFDIKYLLRMAVKGQVLVDLVAEFTEELDPSDPKEVGVPKEVVRMRSQPKRVRDWYHNNLTRGDYNGKIFEAWLLATNNEAEYEAL